MVFGMKSCVCRVFCALVFSVLLMPCAFSATLSGNAFVNQTSDTAASAKSIALNTARRQIIYDVLSRYSDKDALAELVKSASNDDLANLISSTAVSNEHIASDAYSANITMNIDNDIAKKWLISNDIQNWIPAMESGEKFTASIVVLNGISDWAELKRLARSDNIDIETQSINGNQIIAKMPLNYRTKFTAAIRAAGWKYTDNEGVLQIWK